MASQKGLGRGLGALLGDLTEEPESTGGLKTLPLHKIEPNPNQPAGILTMRSWKLWQSPSGSMVLFSP